MKKVALVLTLLIGFTLSSLSQKRERMKSELVSYKYKQDSTWYDWDNWGESKVKIIHDIKNDRFKIKDREEKIYIILESLEKRQDDVGDEILEWSCVNSDGQKCIIKIVTLNSFDKEKQFYIEYSYKKISYHLR